MDKDLIYNEELDLYRILMDLKPRGIIHAGAHVGNAIIMYVSCNINNRCWIEADPETFKKLLDRLTIYDIALNYAVCDRDEIMQFIRTNNDQSNSLYKLKDHSICYPGIVEIETIQLQAHRIDTLIEHGFINIDLYDVLLMDIQGAEFHALQGFTKNIKHINHVIAEINYRELYEGCMLVDDFDCYMETLGFTKVEATCYDNFGWGDALYSRL